MKVIITGSRDWVGGDAEDKLRVVLNTLLVFAKTVGEKLTIVHGDCPTGADHHADQWARRRGDEVELITYPAQWTLYGKPAGFIRNKVMVEAGADMVIGFLRNNSRGTSDCLAQAKAAGIMAKVVEWDPEWKPTHV